MEKQKSYSPYIDELKGLAMLLMVMAHAMAWCHEDFKFLFLLFAEQNAQQVNASLVFKAIYSFHMPLLFMVSGFLFYNGKFSADDVKAKLKSRCMRILLPYITTGFLQYAYSGNYGCWFLQVLLVINLIVLAEYYLLNRLKQGVVTELIVHITCFMCLHYVSKIQVHPDIHLSHLPSSYMAFVIGVYLKRYAKVCDFVKSDKVSLCMIAIFVLLYGASVMLLIPSQMIIVITGLSVSMCLFLFAVFSKRKESHSLMSRGLQLMGKNSLEIYVLHIFFVPHICEIGEYFLSPIPRVTVVNVQIVYSFITAIVAISVCLALAKLLSYNKYLKLALFGKAQ